MRARGEREDSRGTRVIFPKQQEQPVALSRGRLTGNISSAAKERGRAHVLAFSVGKVIELDREIGASKGEPGEKRRPRARLQRNTLGAAQRGERGLQFPHRAIHGSQVGADGDAVQHRAGRVGERQRFGKRETRPLVVAAAHLEQPEVVQNGRGIRDEAAFLVYGERLSVERTRSGKVGRQARDVRQIGEIDRRDRWTAFSAVDR